MQRWEKMSKLYSVGRLGLDGKLRRAEMEKISSLGAFKLPTPSFQINRLDCLSENRHSPILSHKTSMDQDELYSDGKLTISNDDQSLSDRKIHILSYEKNTDGISKQYQEEFIESLREHPCQSKLNDTSSNASRQIEDVSEETELGKSSSGCKGDIRRHSNKKNNERENERRSTSDKNEENNSILVDMENTSRKILDLKLYMLQNCKPKDHGGRNEPVMSYVRDSDCIISPAKTAEGVETMLPMLTLSTCESSENSIETSDDVISLRQGVSLH